MRVFLIIELSRFVFRPFRYYLIPSSGKKRKRQSSTQKFTLGFHAHLVPTTTSIDDCNSSKKTSANVYQWDGVRFLDPETHDHFADTQQNAKYQYRKRQRIRR